MTILRPGMLAVVWLVILMALLQWLGPEVLRYEPRQLAQGDAWRLVTGHWVHANWTHYALNMAGLILCWALTEVSWGVFQWVLRIVPISLGVSGLLWVLQPDTGWYVGFSGVLFGLYVLAAIDSLPRQRYLAWTLLGVIALKLILDMIPSVKIDSSDLIGVPVLAEAHLYGVVVALLVLVTQHLLNFLRVRYTQELNE